MAETAVCAVIDRLVPLLSEGVKLLGGIHGEVADIKQELESIQSFLKEADARAEKEDASSSLRTWVKQVQNIAYRIEDVIDEYMIHEKDVFLISSILKTVSFAGKLKKCSKIASEIRDIKSAIKEIKERSGRYSFSSYERGSSSTNMKIQKNPRVASLFLEEDEVVGVESAKDELIGTLIGGASNRSVVSIVGMGGLGKTTLAKTVFDNDKVRRHFFCQAWITVSQTYAKEELLRNVLRMFCQGRKESTPDGIDVMEQVSLITNLREYLQQKRYVVVFDDVWKLDFWEDIEHAMPDNKRGSRIIITTRNSNVASFCKKSSFVHVHELKPLSPDDAFELFCKKTFRFDFEGHCPPELRKLSLDIVEKCRGLPLAIVTVGGLLSTKEKLVLEWQKLCDSLGSELSCNPHLMNITEILSLSFLDLPYYLKPCFLYSGVFPEGYALNRPRLFGHWIAHGFVKGKKGKTLEQVAEEYLTELVNRNLVQVSWGKFNGVNKWCQVHDMWREIIVSRIEDSSFCHVLEEKDTNFDRKTRCLSLYNNAHNVLETRGNSGSRVRSVLLFKATEKISKSLMVKLSDNFKLLKLLDFEDAPLDHLPSEVGNLFHLSYLNLRNTKLKKLPRSIGKLSNLQTLNVSGTRITTLPAEINRLCKLRHLLARNLHGVKIQEGFGCLEKLQTLVFVDASHRIGVTEELEKLKQLNVLAIQNPTQEDGHRALCASIEKMNKLTALEIVSATSDEALHLDSITSPPQLQDMFLKGQLKKLPKWVWKLGTLVTIGLFSSGLQEDPLQALQNLPNLVNVYLSEAYRGQSLHIVEGGFKRLKLLSLKKMHELTSVMVDKGGATLLEELQIGPSPQLEEVPGGIQHLRNLKTVVFYDMARELSMRLLSEDEDAWKVQHIPTVLFNYRTSEEQHETFKLGSPDLLNHLLQR